MVDYDTLVMALQARGHKVDSVIDVPQNAGIAEFVVDGKVISLEEARELLENVEPK